MKICMGGWYELQGGPPQAWRINITSLPDGLALDALHIGIFEMLASMICVDRRLEGLNPETSPVMVFGDNLGVNFNFISSASKCPICRALATVWFRDASRKRRAVYNSWISGVRNEEADAASRQSKTAILLAMRPETELKVLNEGEALHWLRSAVTELGRARAAETDLEEVLKEIDRIKV